MKTNELIEYQQLYRAVDEILWADWDPIGVNHEPACRDEYEIYTSAICRLLVNGAAPSEIEQHLVNIACVSMGLDRDRGDHAEAAAKICAVCDGLRQQRQG